MTYKICANCKKFDNDCEIVKLAFKNSKTIKLLLKIQEYFGLKSMAEKCTKFEEGRL